MTPNSAPTAAVLGTGFSGFCTALDLHSRGWRVEVFSTGPGATSLSSGGWDIGPVPTPGVVSENLSLRAAYRQYGTEVLRELFLDWADVPSDDSFVRSLHQVQKALWDSLPVTIGEDQPMLLPSTQGTFRSLFAAQAVQAKANIRQLEKVVYGVVGDPHWSYPHLQLCERWNAIAEKMGFSAVFVPITLTFSSTHLNLEAVAVSLELTETERLRFTDLLRLEASKCDALLLPPLSLSQIWVHELERVLDKPICEPLCSRETTAGVRLERAMAATFQKMGIPVVQTEQCKLRWSGGNIEKLEFLDSARQLRTATADQYVLTTGRFSSRGFNITGKRWGASASGLPLFIERDKIWQTAFPPVDDYQKLGLALTADFRPKFSSEATANNLRATGSCIGGVDIGKRKLGLGLLALLGRECAKKMAKP